MVDWPLFIFHLISWDLWECFVEKHPAVNHIDELFLWSAGRGLTVGTSSKWLVTGGKRTHKLCRISPAWEPGASRPQCSCASRLGLRKKAACSSSPPRINSDTTSSLDACDQSCLVEIWLPKFISESFWDTLKSVFVAARTLHSPWQPDPGCGKMF